MKSIYQFTEEDNYTYVNYTYVLLSEPSALWQKRLTKIVQVSELLYLKIINYYKQNNLNFHTDKVNYHKLYDLFKTDFDLSPTIGYLIK